MYLHKMVCWYLLYIYLIAGSGWWISVPSLQCNQTSSWKRTSGCQNTWCKIFSVGRKTTERTNRVFSSGKNYSYSLLFGLCATATLFKFKNQSHNGNQSCFIWNFSIHLPTTSVHSYCSDWDIWVMWHQLSNNFVVEDSHLCFHPILYAICSSLPESKASILFLKLASFLYLLSWNVRRSKMLSNESFSLWDLFTNRNWCLMKFQQCFKVFVSFHSLINNYYIIK